MTVALGIVFALLAALSLWWVDLSALGRTRLERSLLRTALWAAFSGLTAQLLSVVRAYTPPGLVLAALVGLGVAYRIRRRGAPQAALGDATPRLQQSGLRWLLALAACTLLFDSLLALVNFPMGDNYHWSMPYYWRQHRSILPFFAHNARITDLAILPSAVIFPFVAFFNSLRVWVVLLNSALLAASAYIAYAVCIRLGVGTRASLLAVLAWFSTGLFRLAVDAAHSFSLWIFFALGSLYFLAGLRSESCPRERRRLVLCSIFLYGISVGCKNVALIGIPAYAAIVLVLLRKDITLRLFGRCAAVGIAALLCSGVLWNYISNVIRHGGFGGEQLERSRTEQTVQAFWTRNLRGLTFWADVEPLPVGRFPVVARGAQWLVNRLGGRDVLDGERPGAFHSYDGDAQGKGFGLFGLVIVLPGMIAGLGASRRARRNGTGDGMAELALLYVSVAFVLVHGLLFWGVIGRFRLLRGYFVVAIPLVASLIERRPLARHVTTALLVLNCSFVALKWSAYTLRTVGVPPAVAHPGVIAHVDKYTVRAVLRHDESEAAVDIRDPASGREMYRLLAQRMPLDNRTVAYIANANSLDYYPLAALNATLIPVPDTSLEGCFSHCIVENLRLGDVRIPETWSEAFSLTTPTHILLAVYTVP